MLLYTVQKGDSLWSIAKQYGVSLESLIKANPQIKDPNKIYPGQQIRVPVSDSGELFAYTVKKGDTMWSIAKRFGVSLESLIRANPKIKDPNKIYPGQTVYVPAKAATPAPPAPPAPPMPPAPPAPEAPLANNGRLYIIKAGDTFFNIAQRFALNLESLILANPQIKNCDRLTPGMQIYLNGYHYVKAGETLWQIAGRYNVELDELIRINPQIEDPDRIAVGQRIAIPRQPDGMIATYTVKAGDTLFKIAQNYNVTVEALMNANRGISDPDLIYPGRQLQIPGPHLVQKGQTLSSIAALYGISLRDLIAANPQISDPDRIFPQTMVTIPVTQPQVCREEEERAQCAGVDYVVQKDDTLTAIAAMYNVSVDDLLAANSAVSDPDLIYPGQTLRIPIGCTKSVCYTVKAGDTLYKIARMYGVSLNSLLAENPQIEDADQIYPGQTLRVPLRQERMEEDATADFPGRCADCPWYPGQD